MAQPETMQREVPTARFARLGDLEGYDGTGMSSPESEVAVGTRRRMSGRVEAG